MSRVAYFVVVMGSSSIVRFSGHESFGSYPYAHKATGSIKVVHWLRGVRAEKKLPLSLEVRLTIYNLTKFDSIYDTPQAREIYDSIYNLTKFDCQLKHVILHT